MNHIHQVKRRGGVVWCHTCRKSWPHNCNSCAHFFPAIPLEEFTIGHCEVSMKRTFSDKRGCSRIYLK